MSIKLDEYKFGAVTKDDAFSLILWYITNKQLYVLSGDSGAIIESQHRDVIESVIGQARMINDCRQVKL